MTILKTAINGGPVEFRTEDDLVLEIESGNIITIMRREQPKVGRASRPFMVRRNKSTGIHLVPDGPNGR